MTTKHKKIISYLYLALIAYIVICQVPIQLKTNFQFIGWLKLGMLLPVCFMLYHKIILTKIWQNVVTGVFLLAVTFLSRRISESLFFGDPIASAYYAEAPGGSEELSLYKDNKCALIYAGILGPTEQFYGSYSVTGDTVFVLSPGSLLELEERKIRVDRREFVLWEGK